MRWSWPLLPGNSNSARGDGLKLCQGRFRLDIRRDLFSIRAVAQAAQEVVESPSLEVIQSRVDVALRTWSAGMVGMSWWFD